MKQKAIILYGPPGSGKGTQAELLVKKFNFIHFDTGRYLENLFSFPLKENLNDPIFQKEKENFETGKLCTPSWVLKIVKKESEKIFKSGFNLIYSGSPRTLYEAFGDKKEEGLIHFLIKRFKKENIFIFFLKVKEKDSIIRNSHRRICSVCGLPFLKEARIKRCAFCGGELKERVLDKKEVIKVRLVEFKNRTYPIIKKIKEMKLNFFEIDGQKMPYLVHQAILKKLQ